MICGCRFAAPGGDPGLPGVAATSAAGARAPFVRMMIGVVRGELDSWSSALSGAGPRSLAAHYLDEASIVQPGGDALKAADVSLLSDSLARWVSAGSASQLDVDVTDGMAYAYGAYELEPRRGGTAGSRGRHLTVFRSNGTEWGIRLQMFVPVTENAFPTVPGGIEPGMIDFGRTESGKVPTEAYREALAMTAEFSRGWEARDVRALRRLFARNGLVHFPGNEIAARGEGVEDALRAAMEQFETLQTADLDFTSSGRLTAVIGRYVAGAGSAFEEGYYAIVLLRDGNAWRIRALLVG